MENKLLIQSFNDVTVTTSIDGVPVIHLGADYIKSVPMIVNFLRSGCRSVQALELNRENDFDELNFRKMEKILTRLQLRDLNEYFIIQKNHPIITIIRQGASFTQ